MGSQLRVNTENRLTFCTHSILIVVAIGIGCQSLGEHHAQPRSQPGANLL